MQTIFGGLKKLPIYIYRHIFKTTKDWLHFNFIFKMIKYISNSDILINVMHLDILLLIVL